MFYIRCWLDFVLTGNSCAAHRRSTWDRHSATAAPVEAIKHSALPSFKQHQQFNTSERIYCSTTWSNFFLITAFCVSSGRKIKNRWRQPTKRIEIKLSSRAFLPPSLSLSLSLFHSLSLPLSQSLSTRVVSDSFLLPWKLFQSFLLPFVSLEPLLFKTLNLIGSDLCFDFLTFVAQVIVCIENHNNDKKMTFLSFFLLILSFLLPTWLKGSLEVTTSRN